MSIKNIYIPFIIKYPCIAVYLLENIQIILAFVYKWKYTHCLSLSSMIRKNVLVWLGWKLAFMGRTCFKKSGRKGRTVIFVK